MSETIITTFPDGLRAWMVEQAKSNDYIFLLAHADDGVIWGKFESDGLKLAGDAFPVVSVDLSEITLQQARLFGPDGECLVWRVTNGFKIAYQNDTANSSDTLEEQFLLWGEGDKPNLGFTLMREGQQGLLHAPPLADGTGKKAILKVRHYIEYDEDGQAYISRSRLVNVLFTQKEG